MASAEYIIIMPAYQPTRYCDLPNVKIDRARLPRRLQPIYRTACKWGIISDEESYKWIAACEVQELKKFLIELERVLPDVEAYIFDVPQPVPVPHEVVLFQMVYRVYMETKHALPLRKKI
jgi:hypothetical protein